MLFRNRGGCSDIPDFREITNEDVFAGANIMFQGWPYSYRAVKSTFSGQLQRLNKGCGRLHILLQDCVLQHLEAGGCIN